MRSGAPSLRTPPASSHKSHNTEHKSQQPQLLNTGGRKRAQHAYNLESFAANTVTQPGQRRPTRGCRDPWSFRLVSSDWLDA
jgi:hypothetical protein